MWKIRVVHEPDLPTGPETASWRPLIEGFIAEAARKADDAPQSPGERERYRGIAAGFSCAIRGTSLLSGGPPTGSEMRVAGLLTGSLQGSLIRQRREVDSELMLRSAVYASMVAMWVADKGTPDNAERLLAAHTAACIRVHRAGHEVAVGEERAFFSWLLTQAGMHLSTELLKRYERLRVRRLQRHGG